MKRVLTLCLVLLLSISLVACASNKTNSSTKETVVTTESTVNNLDESINTTETETTNVSTEKPSETIASTTLPEETEVDTESPAEQTSWESILMKTSGSYYTFSKTAYDPRGNMYTNVIYLYSSATQTGGRNGKLELYTAKKYNTLSCSIVPQYDFTTKDGTGAYIEIYNDDILSYTSDLITYKTNALDIDLDISGTEYVQLKIINVNPKYPYMANADVLICDPYVSE